jgi:hypothetical protein
MPLERRKSYRPCSTILLIEPAPSTSSFLAYLVLEWPSSHLLSIVRIHCLSTLGQLYYFKAMVRTLNSSFLGHRFSEPQLVGDAGTVVTVGLSILIGSFSCLIVGPNIEGASQEGPCQHRPDANAQP